MKKTTFFTLIPFFMLFALSFYSNKASAQVYVPNQFDAQVASSTNATSTVTSVQSSTTSPILIIDESPTTTTITTTTTATSTITTSSEPQLSSDEESVQIDSALSQRLRGRILNQVQKNGRIWYVNPVDLKRYEVTFANALPLFQRFSLGISNSDLAQISETKKTALGTKLRGRILLQAESRGQIQYVDVSGLKHEVTWNNLMPLFSSLALGISNADLNKIRIGDIVEANDDESQITTNNTKIEGAINNGGSTVTMYGSTNSDTIKGLNVLSWKWTSENNKYISLEQSSTIKNYGTYIRRTREVLYGIHYGIGGFFEFFPANTNFKNDAYINISYTDDEIKNINENELSIYVENASGSWTKVSSTINLASNIITAKITSTGTYTAGVPYDSSKIDSDNDGLSDEQEINTYKTDPDNPDSDNDTYLDGEEVQNGYDPLKSGRAKL